MKRFWDKVNKTDECWLWTASTRSGYGAFKVKGRVVSAHRFVWFLKTGKHPDGLVLHRCNNKRCVNPEHLYIGTHRDNTMDAIAVGVHNILPVIGNRFAKTKLSLEQANVIRTRYHDSNISYSNLAKEYGVHKTAIGQIIRNESWKDMQMAKQAVC